MLVTEKINNKPVAIPKLTAANPLPPFNLARYRVLQRDVSAVGVQALAGGVSLLRLNVQTN